MAIIEALDEVTTAMDQKKFSMGIFIDLRKAFDTIDHTILLSKLEKYGIRGVAGSWVNSYLSNRMQYVQIGQCTSNTLGIACGVPQGSVLGPKLFNLYINDIFNASQDLKLILFADDTSIFYSSESYNELISVVNRELKVIKKWMDINKLSLNIEKTKAITFRNVKRNEDLQITIDDVQIEKVSEIKFLGIKIDNKLSWKPHIRYIKSKISRCLSVINKAKPYLDVNSLRTLYCSLVLPYLSYCAEVWGNTYQSNLNPLVILQKRAVRIIHKVGFLDHTHDLFIQSKLLKLHDLVKYNTSIFMFKAFNKLLPVNLQHLFSNREHSQNLRGFGNLTVPKVRTTCKSFCVSVCGVKLWNSLDVHHKQCQTILRFKLYYKRQVWLKYIDSGS